MLKELFAGLLETTDHVHLLQNFYATGYLASDVEADLVECASNVFTSIPALCNTSLIQHVIVLVVTP